VDSSQGMGKYLELRKLATWKNKRQTTSKPLFFFGEVPLFPLQKGAFYRCGAVCAV